MKKKVAILPLFLSLALIFPGCLGLGSHYPAMTQLEIRQMQTFIFDESDFRLVMKAMMNVLQDEGFNIQNVHLELGFLTSRKEIDLESTSRRLLVALFGAPDARFKKMSVIDATGNVSEYGDKTKVRVNFQVKELDNYQNPINVRQIQEAEFYQDFFVKVSKSIFIQKEKL